MISLLSLRRNGYAPAVFDLLLKYQEFPGLLCIEHLEDLLPFRLLQAQSSALEDYDLHPVCTQ
jgi:hypothetical protein